jgi:hypothetical protein
MAIDFNAPSQVRPYANLGAFPATGAVKTIYIAEDTNYIYRWTGTAYVEISVADLVGYVPYTGATTDVNLGTHSLTARNITVNHPSGSGVAVSITKGGAGEALTVVKTSGSGNAMSVTGGVTQLDELHLTTDLADAYIASATTWNNKVPQTRTLTINGTTQDLSADRTFTISTGITIGTTAVTSGTVGRVLFEGTGNVVQESANLFWDNTNGRLGIGTSSPAAILHTRTASAFTFARIETTASSGSLGSAIEFKNGTNTTTIGSNLTRTYIYSGQGVTENVTINHTGNVGINTTTDAGYKLDVNGTARVSGALTLGTGTSVASSISYGTTYGVTIWGNTGSNSDLLLTDRGGNLRFRIVNGGNILQTSSVINDISIGVVTSVAKSIVANGTYGMTITGGVASLYNLSLVENTGNNGIFIDSSGNAKVGVYNSTYNSSAILEAVSTTKGFLPPRGSNAQMLAIASPATGLIFFDNTNNKLNCYDGTTWQPCW